jgi:hypothetical protein
MRRIIPAVLLLIAAGLSLVRAEPAVGTTQLRQACSLQGQALSQRVSDEIVQNPRSVGAIAKLSRRCSCEQATSMARGVVRAMKAIQDQNPEAVEPMFRELGQSCSCGADESGGQSSAGSRQRCEADRQRRQADALGIHAPSAQDCFCAAAASLGAQAFAGDAQRFGFFPDEGAFSGGGVGPGFGVLAPSQSVTGN